MRPTPADTRTGICGYTIASKVRGTPTMSSREIAELCDKRRDHVCRDIENLNLEYDKLSLPNFGQCDYTHEQNGQTYYEYLLVNYTSF